MTAAESLLKNKQHAGIREMFDEVAPKYDFLNHLLSAGNDFYWRWRAKQYAASFLQPVARPEILDIATGTGDLAVAMSELQNATVVGVDLSDKMLDVARVKAPGIKFELGTAESLRFADGTFNLVTAGFGVRNFENLAKGVAELCRVLKPDGHIIIIEPMIPRPIWLRSLYLFYFKKILPKVARLVSDASFAYDYLPRSVEAFPQCEAFLSVLGEAGFKDATFHTMTFETAILYTARK